MKPNTKDWIQYMTAIVLVISGIAMAFLSFFLNNYNIAEGALIYIAQAFVFAGGIFGISLYIKSKISEFKTDVMREMQNKFREQEEGHTVSHRYQGSVTEP